MDINVKEIVADPKLNPLGLTYDQVRKRINRGWDLDRALSHPLISPRKYPVELFELAKKHGVSEKALRARLQKGWDQHKAATTPPMSLKEAGRMGKKASHWSDPRPSGIKWMAP